MKVYVNKQRLEYSNQYSNNFLIILLNLILIIMHPNFDHPRNNFGQREFKKNFSLQKINFQSKCNFQLKVQISIFGENFHNPESNL